MFDSGEIPDAAFKDGQPVTQGVMSASKPLLPQLAAAGYKPADINYFAMSHYHADHTANANEFAGATWIVQKAERDFMFGGHPQGTIIDVALVQRAQGREDEGADNEDFDVFGDGTVVIMSTPGHTPGHQVLAVKLAHTRARSCSRGDLYHYPEERTTGRMPTFEFNAEQSKASRAKIEQFVKDNTASSGSSTTSRRTRSCRARRSTSTRSLVRRVHRDRLGVGRGAAGGLAGVHRSRRHYGNRSLQRPAAILLPHPGRADSCGIVRNTRPTARKERR